LITTSLEHAAAGALFPANLRPVMRCGNRRFRFGRQGRNLLRTLFLFQEEIDSTGCKQYIIRPFY
jgi:hypothetical protein